jgi:hypothetical protein
VEEAPQILPLAGDPTLAIAGREVYIGSGKADLTRQQPLFWRAHERAPGGEWVDERWNSRDAVKIALIGPAAFGEAVFRALRAAGEQVVAVSSITGTPERTDPLWTAAEADGVPVFPGSGRREHRCTPFPRDRAVRASP